MPAAVAPDPQPTRGGELVAIGKRVCADELSEASFSAAVQRKMEATVLRLKSGSYAQRVQAEYLKELDDRGKAIFAHAVSSSSR